MTCKSKLVRITTVPISLLGLLSGQLRFMNNHFEMVVVSSNGPELKQIAENEGVRVVPINMERPISPLSDLFSLWNMIVFLKKERPTIVHTHTPKAGFIGMIASKIVGIPFRLHTVAGLPLLEQRGIKRKILDFVEKLTYSCATHIYSNSAGLKKTILQNNYCKPDKIKVIGNGSSNGINVERFDPACISHEDSTRLKKSLDISDNDFVYLFVGRLVGDKGVNELVSVFKELSVKYHDAKLLLVGPEEAALDPLQHETLEEIKSNKNILAVGSQSDVRPYFAISSLFTFPSYREGFPNVVMQAGAMGVPSIVSDINGCNEIIIDGINGLIIPVKNKTALRDAMEMLYIERDKLNVMAADTRKLIQERYDQKVVWNDLLEEYRTFNIS